MIAVFLRGELESRRYGEKLRALLARDRRALGLLRRPNVADAAENAYRRRLLDEHRACGDVRSCFSISAARRAVRAELERDEVLDITTNRRSW